MKRTIISIIALTLLAGLQLFPDSSWGGKKPADKSAFYDVKVTSTKGQDGTVATITVKGKGGFHCNTLYPWKLTLEAEPGVVVGKTVLKKKDAAKFSEKEVVFQVKYTPKTGQSIGAKLKLSVCDDKQCKMETVSLTL